MKYIYLLVCVFAVTFSFGSPNAIVLQDSIKTDVSDCDNPNKLSFSNDTLFFDTILDGEKVNFTYNFTVTGCDTIKIHQVYTGCSCTSPSYDTLALAPGDKGKIDIVFKSKGWGDETGNLAIKHIYVLYNGGSQAIFFKGVVVKEKD